MKMRKLVSAVFLTALIGGGSTLLAACGDGGQGGDVQPAKYKVTHDLSDDFQIAGLKQEYAVGEEVSFTVTVKNQLKELSSVKFDGKRVSATDGTYKATMPDHNAEIKVTLADKLAPEFKASYSGKTEVGQTLTVSTTIAGAANDQFTLTATTGANLVTITNHQVALNAAGDVTLKATATSGLFNLEAELSFKILENESSLGTNIAYNTGIVKAGGESEIDSNIGSWLYWSGEGGSISSFTHTGSTYTINYSASSAWHWYAVQAFYKLPYAEEGDEYNLRWSVNSDAAGKITVSGNVIDLQAGDNEIDVKIRQGKQSTLSVQLGIAAGEVTLGGTAITFTDPRLYDANSEHAYHRVKFTADNALLKDIQVRSGKTVVAPEAPKVEGKILDGYYDETVKYDPAMAITKAYNFNAKYIEKTVENIKNVTIMNGATEVAKIEVATGSKLVLPDDINVGFGKRILSLYKDSSFNTPFDANEAINADITLYAKVGIVFEDTFANSGDLGNKIPNDWITNNADGSITLSFNGWGASDAWFIQANFTKSLIVGNAGENYRISFTYSISHDGGNVQIYDGATVASAPLTKGSNQTAQLNYEGGALRDGKKLTFELGAIELDAAVVFTLHSIELQKI